MGRTQNEEKKAVECGYWHLWHFNPAEEEAGKNGFHLDSKEPDWSKLSAEPAAFLPPPPLLPSSPKKKVSATNT